MAVIRNRNYPEQQTSVSDWLLLLILLLLIFWKKLPESITGIFCSCENKPENENVINLPDPELEKEQIEINKEFYERENDNNLLDIDVSQIQKKYFPDTDILKITRNAAIT